VANRMAVAFALGGIITAGDFQEPAQAQDRCGNTKGPSALLDSLIHAHGPGSCHRSDNRWRREILASMMKAENVLSLVGLLEVRGIEVWLDGGWGVDALLGRQTRSHRDLDIVIEQEQVPRLRQLLAARGFKDEPRDDTRPWNFVLADGRGLEVDVHAITFDAEGNGVYGPPDKGELYPAASLTGIGQVQARDVRCISLEWQVKFHSRSDANENDRHDLAALSDRFGATLSED
jgi:lincosamide nucleotidyltransferase A/C/D/E